MKSVWVLVGIVVAILGFLISGDRTYAQGFGERYDFPIPLNYFLIGGALTVALSFVLIGWFIRQNNERSDSLRVNLWEFLFFRLLSRIIVFVVSAFSGILLILSIFSGLAGTPSALDNFVPTFVWIIWWVGVGYIVALVGNVWAIANPWQVIFKFYEKLFISGQ